MLTIDAQIEIEAERQRKLLEFQETYKRIQQETPENKEVLTRTMRQQMELHRPKNTTELWQKIRAVYGISYPWRATDPSMTAPFEWFSNVYFGKKPKSLAMAGRGCGKTMGMGLLQNEMLANNPGWESAHAGATKTQAEILQGYLSNWSFDPLIGKRFKRGAVGKTRAYYNNGSSWKIAIGSMKSISGQHPNGLCVDELEFWTMDAVDQSMGVPWVKNGYDFRIWAGGSTRQRAGGAMNILTEQAEKRGIWLATWTPFEVMQPCQRCVAIDENPHNTSDEARTASCALWKWCGGERAKKSTGWMRREDVIELKQSLGSERQWESQGMCSKPTSGGLVLHNFEFSNRREGGNFMEWRYQEDLDWYVTHDPAEGRKSCMYMIQVFRGHTFVFDEIINPQSSDTVVDKKALIEYMTERGMPKPKAIVVDPARTDSVAVWKNPDACGMSFNAVTPSKLEEHGAGSIHITMVYLREAIGTDGRREFFVNPVTCRGGIFAAKSYSYPSDNQGNVTSDNPNKAYSDEIDPWRYWIMYKRERLDRRTTGGILLV